MVRSVKWRKILLILAIMVAVVGVGGAIAAVLAYHEVTKIDRTNPKVVLDEYLRAALVKGDAVAVDLYTCDDPVGLSPISKLRTELDQREQEFAVEILVSWGAMSRVDSPGRTELTTNLAITAIKDGMEQSSSSQTWRFTVLEQDGWRACGAERLTSSPSVSPSATP
ncbi:hypothetical protein [Catellatospora sichuanensis]|uniref:hypothetical protein n=1 Tax=Catellatospora sichuanensis TaxID=1969805 RepID=UPI001182B2D1|nr:hypothetical protein [Catellatospora sichuanensis]